MPDQDNKIMEKKKDQIHLKLYITMIFCVVVAIFLTSTILYVNFQSILMKHEYKARLSNMETEKARITKLSNMALSTVYQIYNDISVMKLLSYDNINAVDESAAFLQLRYYLTAVPDIDSIYVYNAGNNRIYSVLNEPDLDKPWNPDYDKKDNKFYDRSAVAILNKTSEYLPYIPVPRFYPLNGSKTKCVYSYIMYKTSVENKHRDAVMLNLDSEYLFQGYDNDLDSMKLVIDQHNQVVYSSSDQFSVTSQLPLSFDPEGIIREKDSGYYITDIEGVPTVIMFTGPDKHNFRYISMINYNNLLSQVNRMQTISILITLLLAGAGMAVAYSFSRKLSIPIQSMSKDVKNLRRENRQLQRQDRNRKAAELLENGGLDGKGEQKTGQEFLSLLGLTPREENKLFLVCFYLDNYKSFQETLGTEEIQAYHFAASNILSDLLGEGIKTYHLEMGMDKSLLFLQCGKEVSQAELKEQIKEMLAYLERHFGITFSVIVSQATEDKDCLYEQYESIMEALTRTIFYGSGYLIFLSESELKDDVQYEYPEQREKQLTESLMLGKAQEARMIFEEIISETNQYPIIIYNMVISRLVFAIGRVVTILKKNGLDIFPAGFFALSNLIQESDSLSVRNERFFALFERIQGELERRKSDKQEQIIEKINAIIEKEYQEAAFSLDYLADSIGMSNAYMSRLYKQYTGITIMERLGAVRMNRARELLLGTQLPVNEIAERVGYSGSTYFYRVFKKENGVTPNEYRRK
ncbi:AraC family transcriptional regulator [Anaerocolumna sp. AGMB13025]|uniref:helix-turn-helix domain-containing protein n=1 Tax=Anaerocolumna sp. AGMB13025 TaxID=3039116 RepID=UPI00241E4DAB|nr:AraC family transcriptional regulator [Anaerocolumna sp. AGMB13025]WFR55748.1 AraC family transcriptional regulator [Anaerocolumna sp. AGMB13025]